MRTQGSHLCFSKGLLLSALLATFSLGTKAQTTYYSKAAATDFNAPASWGTNTDGTGTSPVSITNADNYIVANNAALALSGSASVRQLTVNSGSLNMSANTLTVAVAGANNSTLAVNGGTLTVSGGTLNVNGNMLIASGANFTQSGGDINVDGNSGAQAGSVASGTPIFAIGTTTTSYGSGTISLTGGTMTIVDPSAGTGTSEYAFWANLTANSNNITAVAPHTLQFGNGISVDTGGSANGFFVYFWEGTGAYKAANLTINTGSALKRHVTMQYKAIIGGSITVTSGELRMPGTGPNNVAGNVTVAAGGILTNTATLVFSDGAYTSSTAITNAPATNPQTISGAGLFQNLVSNSKANFTSISVNNTSATGVTFSNAGTLLSGSNTGTVSGTLNFIAGMINTGTNAFVLGTDTNNIGTLSHTAGGFGGGSTLTRWYKAATAGTTISANAVPSIGTGSYPFIAGVNTRHFHVNRPATTGATGGTISVKYTDGTGLNTIPAITDGTYNVDRQSAANWTVSTGNGFAAGTGTFTYAAAAQGIYSTITGNSRLMQASTLPGTHQPGTTLPLVQRAGIPAGSAMSTYYAGYSSSELPIESAQSGAWETPSTWVGGTVPACGQTVAINNGHTVTVSATTGTANCSNIINNTGAALVVSGGILNVGCTNNNSLLSNTGTLTVSGGTVNINGNLAVNNGSTFNHSGGTINIDGNAGGVAANSVASGTPLLAIGTSGTAFATGTVSLTGGTIVITDPHMAGTNTNGYAVYANMASGVFANAATAHTVQFGNGTSADTGGHTSGFYISTFAGSGRLNFGNLTVNSAAGANRNVLQTGTTVINGNLTVTAGTYSQGTGTTNVGGNISVAGTFLTGGTVNFCATTGTTAAQQTVAQSVSVSGTGVIQNLATSPTANFNSINVQNTSATGVTFNTLNSPTGNANVAANVLNNITFNGKATTAAGKALLWGTASAAGGTLTVTSGGMTSGSTFARGHSAATTGSAINANAAPTSTTSMYPFVDASGNARLAWVSRVTPTATGIIGVTYTDAAGTSPVSIVDGAYTVNQQYNGKWTMTTAGTTPSATTYIMAISAVNAFGTSLSAPNARITTASATVGTHQTGTVLPNAQRTGLTLAQLTAQDFYIGVNTSDIPFASVTTGAWETPATWNKNAVPGCTDSVVISNGHNVTVNTTAGNCAKLTINSGGTLTVAGNTLTIGCTNNNTTLANNGTLTVTGGTLNINGNLAVNSASVFNQSGGTINVDGNAGAPAGSVASGTPLVLFAPSAANAINLTGGTLVIVDPHTATSTTGGLALSFQATSVTYNVVAGAAHTLQFGNGSSNDTGGHAFGFWYDPWGDTGGIVFGKMIINTGNAAKRHVNQRYQSGTVSDFTILSGDFRDSTAVFTCGGNFTVNPGGTFTNTRGLVMAQLSYVDALNVSFNLNPNAQTISGTGTFRNLATAPTANLTSLTVNNSNAAGVTLNIPLTTSGTATASALTLTQGFVNTTAANLLTVGTSAQLGTITGGAANAYVKGPLGLVIPASRTGGTFLPMPVGKTGYNPAAIDPVTTAGGPVTFTGEAFDSNTGTAGSGIQVLNTGRRWEIPVTNGAANLTSTQVRIADAALVAGNGLGMASSAASAYNIISGAAFGTGTPNTLSSTIAVPVTDYTGFFGFGTTGPLALGTITAVQQTGGVEVGTNNNNILRIDIPNSGSIGSITLTGVTVAYTGTAASDIAANGVTLWTGTATAPGTQIGTAQSLSGGSATFSGLSVNSAIGSTTYLWVRLNTSATAVIGNNVDMKINAGGMTFTSAGGATAPGSQPVVMLDPAGNRPISYCITNLGGGGTSLDTVQILTTTLNNATPGNAPGNYTSYPATGSTTATLQKGSTYTLHAAYGGSSIASVWIDYDHSGTFTASEWTQINTSGTSGNASITIPATALTGPTGMRVRNRAVLNANGAGDACTNFGSGETEDYLVNIICVNPVVALGNDTAVCSGGTLNLNAGNPGAAYSWSTGATTQSISVATAGTYSVTVTNNGCSGNDTIVVTAGTLPVAVLGNDTTICQGTSLTLNAGTAGTYSWSTGVATQTISVNATGTYSVTLSNPGAGCSDADTIVVAVSPIPTFSLGNDTSICTGGTLPLTAQPSGTYLWSTGATTQSINVAAAGTYWAEVENTAGCSHTDTMVVSAGALPVATLGNDTSICQGTSLTLNGGTAATYSWSTGAATQTIAATTAGNYSVTLSNPGAGCTDADTMTLTIDPLPTAGTINTTNNSPSFTFTTAGSANVTTYSWNFGDGSSPATGATVNHTYTVNGTYTVTLTVTNNCGTATTTTSVTIGGVGVGTVPVSADDLKLFPNPSSGTVTISNVSALKMQRLSVTNAMGAVVLQKDDLDKAKDTIDVGGLAAGVYTIRIQTDKGVVIRLLQVLH